jgi:superfamily II helicase
MSKDSISCFIKGFTKDWEEGAITDKEFIGFIKNELEKVESNMKCPVCKTNDLLEEGTNALSRKDNETEICDECGTAEAMEELQKLGY